MDKLEVLRIFYRVAEAKSFSGVASEFHMTQPMVSKRIAWLENEIGSQLFRRTTRGLSLTEEGQIIYQKGKLLSDEMDSLFATVRDERFKLEGTLRMTASLAYSRLMLAPKLKKFSEEHRGLKLHFQLSDGYIDLIENNIDLAIRIGVLEDSSLKAVQIGISNRNLYASKKYLQKFGVPKNLNDLKKHQCMYYSRLSSIPSWPLREKDQPINYSFEPYMQSDGSDIIRESVINDLGIALMPTWMVDNQKDAKDLQIVLPKYSPIGTPIYAVMPYYKELGLKQRAMIDFLKKNLK